MTLTHDRRRVRPAAITRRRPTKQVTVHPPLGTVGPGRCSWRRLLPGWPTAPGWRCLALLPSGPDAVHKPPLRGTWRSTPNARALIPNPPPLRAGIQPG